MVFAWRVSAIRRRHAAWLGGRLLSNNQRNAFLVASQSTFTTSTCVQRPVPSSGAKYPHVTGPRADQHAEATQSPSSAHVSIDDQSFFADSDMLGGGRRTVLPTPLPTDVLKAYHNSIVSKQKTGQARIREKNGLAFGDFSGAALQQIHDDTSFFPSSHMAENIAILHACLGTNLLNRALKIFAGLREENAHRVPEDDAASLGMKEPTKAMRHKWATSSMLSRNIYNLVFAAIFRRAVSETRSSDTQRWIDRAWTLFKEMETGKRLAPRMQVQSAAKHQFTMDPTLDESTVATMAKGLIACVRSHPQISTEQAALSELVAITWRAGLSFDRVLEECRTQVIATEDKGAMGALSKIDARTVAHAMIAASVHSGHEMARVAVEAAESRIITGSLASTEEAAVTPDPAAEFPELLPVQSSAKTSPKLHDSPDARPLNLSLLQRELSIVGSARQGGIRDNEERQRLLEEKALDSARIRLQSVTDQMAAVGLKSRGALSHDTTLQNWMWDWTKKLEQAIIKDLERIKRGASGRPSDASTDASTEASTSLDAAAALHSGTAHQKATQAEREAYEQDTLPLLQLLPPDRLALITVLEIMRLQGTGGVSHGMRTARALIAIGTAVEEEHYAEILRKNPHILKYRRKASEDIRKQGLVDMKARHEAKKWLAERMIDSPVPESSATWSPTLRARVGGFLVSHLMSVATIYKEAWDREGEKWKEEHPALYSTYQYLQGKKLGVIKLNEMVARRLERDPLSETLQPRHLPMLVKPCSWLKYDEGGYLIAKSRLMRVKDSPEQASYVKAASEAGNLEVVMSGLDVLGDTPWTINKKVFSVVTEVWNSGDELAAIPPLQDPEAWREQLERPADYDTNVQARTQYLAAEKKARLDSIATYALRCSVNYKLEIARSFLGEKFYFPHNIDFRGRAYPIPSHLNHIGDDLCRGLLKFADRKRLGKSGLRWLRIHLANVYGYDKANFDEREQFVIDHMADIEDSVKDPLGGRRWWLQSDDPWQTLAACHELCEALQCPEGPENFETNLPVHQDGTCNGLQHYAALGGDLEGAKQVNLASGERPADVYTAVADLAIKRVEEDYERSFAQFGEESIAALLRGKITRKVVKQTVMTTVYGVTFVGAKAQVMKQLEDRGDVPEDRLWDASTYLAKCVLASVGDLFTGAEKIQSWLTESARIIARSIPPERVDWLMSADAERRARLKQEREKGKEKAEADGNKTASSSSASPLPNLQSRVTKEQMTSVIWTTPLALPVVQPYRKLDKRQIATAMQTIFLKDPKMNTEVSPTKQASAFPPNFIHSLDATHMILTALECQQAGLTFAAVHDSYWTHPSDVETMSELIRDCFVRLHTAGILPKLRAEFLERYHDYKVPVVVAQKFVEKWRNSKAAAAAKAATRTLGDGDADADVEAEGAEEKISKSASRAGLPKNAIVMEEAVANAMFGREDDSDSIEAEEAFDRKVRTRFVNLQDLLPPLPEKGSFNVHEIKASKYFFS